MRSSVKTHFLFHTDCLILPSGCKVVFNTSRTDYTIQKFLFTVCANQFWIGLFQDEWNIFFGWLVITKILLPQNTTNFYRDVSVSCQRPLSEEVSSILLPVLATIAMPRGKKSVVRVAQRVAALVPVQKTSPLFSDMYYLFDPSSSFVRFSDQDNGGRPIDHVVIMRCMLSQFWFVLLRHTKSVISSFSCLSFGCTSSDFKVFILILFYLYVCMNALYMCNPAFGCFSRPIWMKLLRPKMILIHFFLRL